MDIERRTFFGAVLPLLLALPAVLARWTFAPQNEGQQSPKPAMPGPPVHGPNPNRRPDVPSLDDVPKPNPAEVLRRNQQEIETDANKLYSLAGQLRDKLQKVNSTKELSVSAIDQTKEIEKLAKHIRSLLAPG